MKGGVTSTGVQAGLRAMSLSRGVGGAGQSLQIYACLWVQVYLCVRSTGCSQEAFACPCTQYWTVSSLIGQCDGHRLMAWGWEASTPCPALAPGSLHPSLPDTPLREGDAGDTLWSGELPPGRGLRWRRDSLRQGARELLALFLPQFPLLKGEFRPSPTDRCREC